MPDGDYVILGFEQRHISLAWREADGQPSKKHRYRVEDLLIRELMAHSSNRESMSQS
jgi:hypothetical protein